MLDLVLAGEINPEHIVDILTKLCTNSSPNFKLLSPRVIQSLFNELTTHVLKNYVSKENWLRQCYSIQNGSFQNLEAMESVPMSKFAAMCQIHQQAIEQITPDSSTVPEVQ